MDSCPFGMTPANTWQQSAEIATDEKRGYKDGVHAVGSFG